MECHKGTTINLKQFTMQTKTKFNVRFQQTFSRHGKVRVNSTLLIWLNENVDIKKAGYRLIQAVVDVGYHLILHEIRVLYFASSFNNLMEPISAILILS